MRNLFLILLLANLLLLAWQQWINPATAPPRAGASAVPGLALYREGPGGRPAAAPAVAPGPGACVRIGPFPDSAAATTASRTLEGRHLGVAGAAREGRAWLGRWVQIPGFPTADAAEEARRKLAAGGLADAYLIQEGSDHIVSLGVFREQERAERVAAAARQLGFAADIADRYRPVPEYWLVISPPAGGTLAPADLALPEAGILRRDLAACGGDPFAPVGGAAPPP